MNIRWNQRRCSKSVILEEHNDTMLQRKPSEISSDPLESMVSCPIHLGMMEHPKQLPCGHSLCHECLASCLRTYVLRHNKFPCPVCRTDSIVPENGADGWPVSYTLNGIIDYINENKMKKMQQTMIPDNNSGNKSQSSCGTTPRSSISCSDKSSILEKADMIKHLLHDIDKKKHNAKNDDRSIVLDELKKMYDKMKNEEASKRKNSIDSLLSKIKPNSNSNGNINTRKNRLQRNSSAELNCRTELIRHEMSKMCEYKIYKEKKTWGESIASEVGESCYWDCVDIEEEPMYRKIIFINDKKQITIVNCHDNNEITFDIILSNDKTDIQNNIDMTKVTKLDPVYLKLFRDHIYLSVLIQQDFSQSIFGILLKFDLEGNLLANSNIYCNESNNLPPIYGFDLDNDGHIFLTQPDLSSICVLNEKLEERVENSFRFHDSNLYPQYVCYSSKTHEVWASCPTNNKILILDEITGSYTQFGTGDLYNSLPAQIICTRENRICFLDSRLSRVFWLKKTDHILCIQRLVFIGSCSEEIKNSPFHCLRSLPDSNQLFINTNNGAFVAKPTKLLPDNNSNAKSYACCNVM